MTVRVGVGYDSHRFVVGRPLVLGGLRIAHPFGLAGHSDADAVAHALTDAILGAAGAGNIGQLFPDSDPQWKDADSMELLRTAHELVRGRGYAVVQADLTVITEAARLGLGPGAVNVKAKTNEGMGFIGRGEGLAVIAVATLEAR
jgi:2-C-methyl-D-erythritol 2,4-cyclodiphosphate synthase